MAEIDLKKSKETVGALYPVLLDANGNVIDGLHRLEADPDWPKQKLDWVKTEEDRELVRAHANMMRRDIPFEERRKSMVFFAEKLKEKGVKRGRIVSDIAKMTGFTDRWVREVLPDEFKAVEHAPEPVPVEPAPEPVFTGESWECPVCGGTYKIFHVSPEEHKFDLVRRGTNADKKA